MNTLRPRGDGASALTIYAVLLMVLPSRFVIAALGAAGTPAQLFGDALVLWWLGHKLGRSFLTSPITQPIRRAMLAFSAAVLISYVAAAIRPIDAIELRAADRALLSLISWLGVVLVAGDEIATLPRLVTFLRRVIVLGGAVAGFGLVQFLTGRAFTEYLRLPGLSENSELNGVFERVGFARPAGTALHPIEFGVMVTMLLPLALHFALNATGRAGPRRWLPLLLLALAVPISVSRSAVVCGAVGILLMLPVLRPAARRLVYAGALSLGMAIYLVLPGMLGALVALFSTIGQDSSAASRTDSYQLALDFIGRAPLFGRGMSTFLPGYRILDNQYLMALIETGVVGLVALLSLFGVACWTALRAQRLTDDPVERQLGQALLASTAAGAVSFALFDAFSFPMVAATMFILIGCIGAYRRILLARTVGAQLTPSRPSHLAVDR